MQNHEAWLLFAKEDLLASKALLKVELFSSATYHCQQAAEKSLKAFLIFHEQEIAKTHNVDALLKKCIDIDPDFSGIDLKNINFFGVSSRYPDDFYVPDKKECKEYLEIARIIKKLVEEKINLQ